MPPTLIYENPGENMAGLRMETDSQGLVTMRNINGVNLLNPHPGKGRHHKKKRHYNPLSTNFLGRHEVDTFQPMMSNPDIGDQLINGSPVTQDISPVDVGVGTLSFLLNNWLARQVGLTGTSNLIVSAIIPFVTGAAASMLHSRFGSAVFFGGELDAALKIMAKVPGLKELGGLHEAGTDWVLQSLPKVNVTVPSFPHMGAPAQLPMPTVGATPAPTAHHSGLYNMRYSNPSSMESVYRDV